MIGTAACLPRYSRRSSAVGLVGDQVTVGPAPPEGGGTGPARRRPGHAPGAPRTATRLVPDARGGAGVRGRGRAGRPQRTARRELALTASGSARGRPVLGGLVEREIPVARLDVGASRARALGH